ncbi:hypothetical protein PsorP6_011128 [Peronosclerospora sorghi]|uniref:Uncharacterized protein n=1 Tax=Peronosclerospora sorghi TaxID=230839 RepID=A0ACC0VWP1_9STRA|nr:hypothetical protein PsorP6_011128 [Peronosclerospora sorghi]
MEFATLPVRSILTSATPIDGMRLLSPDVLLLDAWHTVVFSWILFLVSLSTCGAVTRLSASSPWTRKRLHKLLVLVPFDGFIA